MLHRAPDRSTALRSLAALWRVGLLRQPQDQVSLPIPDVAADLEAARSTPEMPPVPQGSFGNPKEAAGLLEGEHLVSKVRTESTLYLTPGRFGGHRSAAVAVVVFATNRRSSATVT